MKTAEENLAAAQTAAAAAANEADSNELSGSGWQWKRIASSMLVHLIGKLPD